MRQKTMAAIFVAALGATGAQAGDPPPFQEFTFKRLQPPAPGTTRRITVQIEPVEEEPAPVARAADAAQYAGGAYDWFWSDVPSGGAGAAGIDDALLVLARAPVGRTAPRFDLDRMRRLARSHGRDILAATVGTRVSPALALAVMAVESGGRARAVSPAGARGLMQLMPATAARFGVGDSDDPVENIRGGIAYLDWLMGHFGGDPLLVLAGYNAGEGAVARYDGVPPYDETRAYVPKVIAAFQVARGLCLTPPMLVSDGCVFVEDRLAANG